MAAAAPVVVAVGSPMLDTTFRLSDEFLERRALRKGDAAAVEDEAAFAEVKAAAAAAAAAPPASSCGGCATNVAKVCAGLGLHAALCGGIGRDEAARTFRSGLAAVGLADATVETDAPTGEVLCLVTPDGERTFAYRSGAASALAAQGLAAALRAAGGGAGRRLALVYADVYVLLCPGQLLEEGLSEARALGARTALNLGSHGIVAQQRARLWALLRRGLVSALTLNAAEAEALCDDGSGASCTPEEAVERCAECCDLVVLTLGADGVVAGGSGAAPRRFAVDRVDRVVDCTGAGDFFAGGFLAAWLADRPLEVCVRWGAAASAEVLQVAGTDLTAAGWSRLRERCAPAGAAAPPPASLSAAGS